MTRRRDRMAPFGLIPEHEAEEADMFWEELFDEITVPDPRRRPGMLGPTPPVPTPTGPPPGATGSPTLPSPPDLSPAAEQRARQRRCRCVNGLRNFDFMRNVSPATGEPHAEICQLYVTRRGSAIRGAPVVDENGRPVPDPQPGEGKGAGDIREPNAVIGPMVQAKGTGFFIAPDRVVTAAHVVLDALEVIVIPGKAGPGMTPASEPFVRQAVPAAQIKIHPDAIAAATSSTGTVDQIMESDLAVIHGLPPPPWAPPAGPGSPPPWGGVFRLEPRVVANRCVHTCGYSSERAAPHFQHCDRGFHLPGGPLIHFDLITEKGASGSPIWESKQRQIRSRPRRSSIPVAQQLRVVGLVSGGHGPLDTISPRLTGPRITWLKTVT